MIRLTSAVIAAPLVLAAFEVRAEAVSVSSTMPPAMPALSSVGWPDAATAVMKGRGMSVALHRG